MDLISFNIFLPSLTQNELYFRMSCFSEGRDGSPEPLNPKPIPTYKPLKVVEKRRFFYSNKDEHVIHELEGKINIQINIGQDKARPRKPEADFAITVANSLKLMTPSPSTSASLIISVSSLYVSG